MKPQRWIVLPDMQVPYEDQKTMKAVEQYIADQRFDGLVNLGDFMDLNCISHWNEGRPGDTEMMRLEDDWAVGNSILDRQQKILRSKNKDARYVLIEGNHEFRAKDMMARLPALKGSLDVEKNLHLAERGVEWVPYWSNKRKIFTLGKANFCHGLFTNQYHAAKMVTRFGRNIYYGHTHDVQEHSLAHLGDNHTIVGKSLGTLCRYDQQYLKGAPTNWQQAFAVFDFFEDGTYTEHTVRIFNHRFKMDGKVYDGRK